jgi:hypothetical protein
MVCIPDLKRQLIGIKKVQRKEGEFALGDETAKSFLASGLGFRFKPMAIYR